MSFQSLSVTQRLQFLMTEPFYHCSVMSINILKRPSILFWLYAHVCVEGRGGTYYTKMSAHQE